MRETASVALNFRDARTSARTRRYNEREVLDTLTHTWYNAHEYYLTYVRRSFFFSFIIREMHVRCHVS